MTEQWGVAVPELETAARLSGGRVPLMLDLLSRAYAETQQDAKAATAKRGAAAARSAGHAR